MDLKAVVGLSATIVTIASFFSGAVVCFKIFKKGTTGELPSLPFIAGTICNVLWLRYGLYLDDSTLIYVNLTGVVLNLCYTLWFYVYAVHKTNLYKQVILSGGFLASLTLYLVSLGEDYKTATYITGMTACAGGLFFCASPLSALAVVFKTKSVESLPFPVIFSTFIVSVLWYFYGILVEDNFIQVPNLVGALLTGFQLLLFAIYPSGENHSRLRAQVK